MGGFSIPLTAGASSVASGSLGTHFPRGPSGEVPPEGMVPGQPRLWVAASVKPPKPWGARPSWTDTAGVLGRVRGAQTCQCFLKTLSAQCLFGSEPSCCPSVLKSLGVFSADAKCMQLRGHSALARHLDTSPQVGGPRCQRWRRAVNSGSCRGHGR